MIRNILLFSVMILFMLGCSKSGMEIAEKSERIITIEVADSEVIKLDGREIHVSFLETQMASLAEDFELITDVQVDSMAVVGVVHDVQKAVRHYSSRYVAHQRSILK